MKINEGVEYTKINANGKQGLLVAIIKQPNANLITLSDAMKKKVEELKKINEYSSKWKANYKKL